LVQRKSWGVQYLNPSHYFYAITYIGSRQVEEGGSGKTAFAVLSNPFTVVY